MSFSPLSDELFCREKSPRPCMIVLFGATGNLAEKKIFPALEELNRCSLLHPQSRIVAVSRKDITLRMLTEKAGLSNELASKVSVVKFDPENGDDAGILAQHLSPGGGNVIYYLAVPPPAFMSILSALAAEEMFKERTSENFCNLVLEKPPGYTLKDVKNIRRMLEKFLQPHQIYLIDHYLGKDEVQNILTLRFANRIFSGVWTPENIEKITIAICEKSGIGKRAGYFDKAGIIRDMFQSHLLIMLALCIMPRPEKFDGTHLNSMLCCALKNIGAGKINFAGQYAGYRIASSTPDTRQILTCADISFKECSKWKNTAFRLCACKAAKTDRSFINIKFRSGDFPFPEIYRHPEMPGNVLELELKPFPGIKLVLCAKKSGPHLCLGTIPLNYEQKEHPASGGYLRLLLDCQNCDRTFFPDFTVFEETGRICDAAEELISAERVAIYSPETLEFLP